MESRGPPSSPAPLPSVTQWVFISLCEHLKHVPRVFSEHLIISTVSHFVGNQQLQLSGGFVNVSMAIEMRCHKLKLNDPSFTVLTVVQPTELSVSEALSKSELIEHPSPLLILCMYKEMTGVLPLVSV